MGTQSDENLVDAQQCKRQRLFGYWVVLPKVEPIDWSKA
jgi:hypothetical protein